MFILDNGENVVRVVRRHWFVMLSSVLRTLFMAVMPIILYLVFKLEFGVGINVWLGFIYSLYILILWTLFFIDWTDYYLDMLLITDKRVMNVNQNGFFRREVISFRYEQIQDITVETRGILQTFFKFGLIQIQTAGEKRCIILKHADNPEEVRNEILNRQTTFGFVSTPIMSETKNDSE